jgi:hypothetical protein
MDKYSKAAILEATSGHWIGVSTFSRAVLNVTVTWNSKATVVYDAGDS